MAKDKKKKAKKVAEPGGASSSFKAFAENPLIGEVVAAALVATASALKDSNRAKALASHAGEELEKLSKAGAERGSVLWDMALQIGKRSLEAMTADKPRAPEANSRAASKKPKAAKSTDAVAKPTKPKSGKKKSAKSGAR